MNREQGTFFLGGPFVQSKTKAPAAFADLTIKRGAELLRLKLFPTKNILKRKLGSLSQKCANFGHSQVATRHSYTATVTDVSVRVTARYKVSRSTGSRPASLISRINSCRRRPCGVVAPASW